MAEPQKQQYEAADLAPFPIRLWLCKAQCRRFQVKWNPQAPDTTLGQPVPFSMFELTGTDSIWHSRSFSVSLLGFGFSIVGVVLGCLRGQTIACAVFLQVSVHTFDTLPRASVGSHL